MTRTRFEQDLAAARREHLLPGREIHLRHTRGYQFCELCLITGTSEGNAIANIWNTTGVSQPGPEQLRALDGDAIARDHGALAAVIGPIRSWTFDRLDVAEAGGDKTFGTITAAWMGAAEAAPVTGGGDWGAYQPAYIYRDAAMTFAAGTQVYVLDAPDGEVFVMESFTRHRDPALSEERLRHLGGRLQLPGGWGFRAETLDRDMEVSAAHHGDLAHVVHDDLHNTYQGSDVARAFSALCRKDSLW